MSFSKSSQTCSLALMHDSASVSTTFFHISTFSRLLTLESPHTVHGLAGTNPFFYDVLTRVAEVDLREIGLETEWFEMKPAVTEETWNGVKRKYWTLETYRLPLSRMQRM